VYKFPIWKEDGALIVMGGGQTESANPDAPENPNAKVENPENIKHIIYFC